jgi:hypothetical protein
MTLTLTLNFLYNLTVHPRGPIRFSLFGSILYGGRMGHLFGSLLSLGAVIVFREVFLETSL